MSGVLNTLLLIAFSKKNWQNLKPCGEEQFLGEATAKNEMVMPPETSCKHCKADLRRRANGYHWPTKVPTAVRTANRPMSGRKCLWQRLLREDVGLYRAYRERLLSRKGCNFLGWEGLQPRLATNGLACFRQIWLHIPHSLCIISEGKPVNVDLPPTEVFSVCDF